MAGDRIRVQIWKRLGRLHERHAVWIQPALTGLTAILLGLGAVNGWFFTVGAVLVVLLIGSQVVSNLWARQEAERTRRDEAKRAQAAEEEATAVYLEAVRRFALLAETLEPVQRAAAAMARQNKPDRRASFMRLTSELLDTIRFVFHVPGLRAVLYTFNDQGDALEVAHQVSDGRRDPAGPLIPGTPRGDTAIARARGGRPLFVPDVSAAPRDWEGSGVGYNTFIAYPITSSSDAFGLLTVDAPLTDDLTEENVSEIGLVAGVAATILANYRRG